MKLSSSGLEALIGGPWVFLTVDPPIDKAAPPPRTPRVIIASCIRWALAFNPSSNAGLLDVEGCWEWGFGATNHMGAELATGDGVHLDHDCGLKV